MLIHQLSIQSKLVVILCLFYFVSYVQCGDNVTSSDETILCKWRNKEEKLIECDGIHYEENDEDPIETFSGQFWLFVAISIFLVLFGGAMSGLTIGLMSLDKMTLEIIKRGGDAKERKYAERIIPVIEKHHLLLVTLLLSNAAAMEALPIFLDRISSPVAAILISVSMVLFFGEIIPQAICHRFGLAVGANLSIMVRVLMLVLFPIAWPISKLLDYILGHEGFNLFRRTELGALVTIHGEENKLTIDETTIIKGALEMKQKTVRNCMTTLDQVFMLEINSHLNQRTMTEIKEQGHSRIPVYSNKRENIKGLLLVKSLLFVHVDETTPIGELELREIPTVSADKDLYDMMNLFQTGRSHMASVYDENKKELVGIVTLEDIIEELIQEEIMDEEDLAYEYAQQAAKVLHQAKMFRRGLSFNKPFGSKKKQQPKLKRVNSLPQIEHGVSPLPPHHLRHSSTSGAYPTSLIPSEQENPTTPEHTTVDLLSDDQIEMELRNKL